MNSSTGLEMGVAKFYGDAKEPVGGMWKEQGCEIQRCERSTSGYPVILNPFQSSMSSFPCFSCCSLLLLEFWEGCASSRVMLIVWSCGDTAPAAELLAAVLSFILFDGLCRIVASGLCAAQAHIPCRISSVLWRRAGGAVSEEGIGCGVDESHAFPAHLLIFTL